MTIDFASVKAKHDIVEYIGQDVQLKKSDDGSYYSGFCPFHKNDKTEAFAVWTKTQTWKCFGECADGGDLFDYYQRRHGVDKMTAYNALAGEPEPVGNLESYARSHHAPVSAFKLAGWADVTTYRNGPALPFQTKNGPRYRMLNGSGAKYYSPKGFKKSWYKFDEAVQLATFANLPLYVVNGEPSVVVAQYHGIPATTLTAGEDTLPRGEQLKQLKEKWEGDIVLAFDCDEAGRKAAKKWQGHLTDVGFRVKSIDLGLGNKQDAADFCGRHGDKSLQALRSCRLLGELPQVEAVPEVEPEPEVEVDPNAGRLVTALESEICGLLPDLPKEYALAASYFHIGAITARRVCLRRGPETLWPNLYVMLMGHSGVVHKSSILRVLTDLLWQVGLPEISVGSPEAFEEEMGLVKPKKLNEAGVDEWLEERTYHAQRPTLIEEAHWLFEATSRAGYMSRMRSILLGLYDCPPRYRTPSTISRGRSTIENVFLSLFGVTTAFAMRKFLGRNSQELHDGTWSRFFLVGYKDIPEPRYFGHESKRISDDLTNALRRLFSDHLTPNKLTNFEDDEAQIIYTEPLEVELTMGVATSVRHFYESTQRRIIEDIKEGEPEGLNWRMNRWTDKSLKLAMILATSDWSLNGGTGSIVVDDIHWNKAVHDLKLLSESSDAMLDNLSQIEDQERETRGIANAASDAQKLKSFILEGKNRTRAQWELSNRFQRWPAKRKKAALDYLGDELVKTEEKPKKGKVRTTFSIKRGV